MRPPSTSSAVPQLHGLQKSGVIWRGSSGRMLMESSARPHSRHSMVYSCSGTQPRGALRLLGPSPTPQRRWGNPSRSWGRHPIPRLQSDRGGLSFIPPWDPISPEPIFQRLSSRMGNVPGRKAGKRRGEPEAPVSCSCQAPELPSRRSPPKLRSSLLRLLGQEGSSRAHGASGARGEAAGDPPVRMGTPVGPYLVVIHHAEGVLVARDQVVTVLAQVCGGGEQLRGRAHLKG